MKSHHLNLVIIWVLYIIEPACTSHIDCLIMGSILCGMATVTMRFAKRLYCNVWASVKCLLTAGW